MFNLLKVVMNQFVVTGAASLASVSTHSSTAAAAAITTSAKKRLISYSDCLIEKEPAGNGCGAADLIIIDEPGAATPAAGPLQLVLLSNSDSHHHDDHHNDHNTKKCRLQTKVNDLSEDCLSLPTNTIFAAKEDEKMEEVTPGDYEEGLPFFEDDDEFNDGDNLALENEQSANVDDGTAMKEYIAEQHSIAIKYLEEAGLNDFFSSYIGGAKGGTPLATLLSRTAGCAQFVYEKVIRFNCDDTLIAYTLKYRFIGFQCPAQKLFLR